MNANLSFEQLPSAVAQLLEKVSNIEKTLSNHDKEKEIIPERFDLTGALSFLNQLGFKISKSKLQKETANRTIPCKRFNKRLLFDPKELQNWAESRTKSPFDQSEITRTLSQSANRKLGGRKL